MSRIVRLVLIFGVLLALGAVIGLVFENIWLGLLLGLIAALVWVIGFESRRGGQSGVYPEDHGGDDGAVV